MIKIENLTFSFQKNSMPFFSNTSITFEENALNFICGKNGIGKSTLFRIIQGDIHPTEQISGTLHINNQQYSLKTLHTFVSSVPQNFNNMLVDTYSFIQNLQLALLPPFPGLHLLPPHKPIPAFIQKYGINPDVPISLLSGGQRQILSILMILQKAPKIVLLDEPTATLDEENAHIIMDFLNELCVSESITIVLIVHNKEIVKKYNKKQYLEITKSSHNTRTISVQSSIN